MYKIIVLADDFTGALDTGVQFAKVGVRTLVTTRYKPSADFAGDTPQVLVVDLESRHLKPDLAREMVREIVQKCDAEYYYKKTDSGMRGNIGAELEGLLRENEALAFIPAFPDAGRTTVNGVHYSDGVPISRTVFGKDPFEPVTRDYVPEIIALQSDIPVQVITHDNLHNAKNALREGTIAVFDAADQRQMEDVAKVIAGLDGQRLLAGCAGFAGYLPKILGLKAPEAEIQNISPGLVVLSGSINRLTLEQVAYAEQSGFSVIEPQPEIKLCGDLPGSPLLEKLLDEAQSAYKGSRGLVIQVARGQDAVEKTDGLAREMGLSKDETRKRIAGNMGILAERMSRMGTLAVFGGDTLMAAMDNIGGGGIMPVAEIVSGVVLSRASGADGEINIITKSGGFGGKDVIAKIADFIEAHS